MPLEHFKTQVLLLHSEQSTLDTLSSGFDDRYTVHCATSGSEALTTLGEVSIHVIVSAQKLPGMSGLDALREARKRSPETIGILLAGEGGSDVEALVGEKDMFQVVRDEVTPETLKQLIDRATQQARLMALAESANDTAANMDQPSGEHIIMETSENGSTIISDGTGKFPALNPGKVSPEAAVGARSVAVLVLTQDEEFLKTIRNSSRGLHDVHHATTISQADEAVRKNRVGVAVIDAAMVGANVEKMALHLRKTSTRLVAIVAGRRDDGEMLMDLINRGKVYRFLLKPVSPGRARLAIDASVKHHLEAPDSAFRMAASGSPAPVGKPAGQAPGKDRAPAAKKPDKAGKPAPIVARREPDPARELPEIRIEPQSGHRTAGPTPSPQPSPHDGLGDAFEDDASFTKTVTGLFRTIVERKSGEEEARPASPQEAAVPHEAATPPANEAPATGGTGLGTPRLLGVSAAVLVLLGGAGWWFMSGGDPADIPGPQSQPSQQARQTDPTTGREDAPTAAQAPATDADAGAAIPSEPVPPPEPEIDLDEVLADARAAVADGRIYSPDGSNAIELYLAAAAEVPDNDQVDAELGATIDRALSMAEQALLERNATEIPTILDRVAMADPDNARLPFLNAQLTDIRLRDTLDEARLAIRENRFDDAGTAIDSARGITGADAAEIDAVAAELEQARIDQRVSEILALASAQLDAGALLEPADDSAQHYYELALATDPDNATARQGLVVIASKLVLKARAEIDGRDFPAAESLLADARSIDPDSAELANADAALAAEKDAVRREREEAERLAAEKARAEREAAERAERERIAREREAAERAEQERLAREREAAERAERERLAREREAAERAAAERAAAERAAAQRAAAAARLAADAQTAPAPQPATRQAPRQSAPPAAGSQPAPAQARTAEPQAQATPRQPEPQPDIAAGAAATPEPQQAAAANTNSDSPTTASPTRALSVAPTGSSPEPAAEPAERRPLPVSALTRSRYVAPKYPRAAERRNLTGWVDVVFTVGTDGSVRDIEVVDSDPGDVFVEAATDAVAKWEFEPVVENGEVIEPRAAVRMMFAIE